MSIPTRASAVLLAFLAIPQGASAQTQTTIAAGPEYQNFSFSDGNSVGTEALSLFSFPVDVLVDINERFALQLSTAFARGEKARPGADALSISGATDTRLSGTLRLANGSASVTGIVALPTGVTEQSLDELEVAGNIASDLLPFRISNWGSGGGVGARAAVARNLGTVGAGVSVGYFVAQEFTPVSFSETDFRPGSNLVVRGALDANVGPAGKFSVQVTARTYGNDTRTDIGEFKSGSRYEAMSSYAFATSRRSSGVIYAGFLQRAEGEDSDGVAIGSPQTLLLGGGGARLRIGGHLLLPTVDLRVLRSDDGIDQGYETGIGARAEIQAGNAILIPLVKLHFGKLQVVEGSSESTYVGTDFGLTIRFTSGR